jgi:protein-tyrosine phosphatase
MKEVLFLGSANYYRSRFAEQLFNALAQQSGLPWRARSRGLLVGKWGDVGPMSGSAIEALRSRGVEIDSEQRPPTPLAQRDLVHASVIAAMKEGEHGPLMAEQFPEWADLVEYWNVDDVDWADPHDALALLEESVRDLVARLAATSDAEISFVAEEPVLA